MARRRLLLADDSVTIQKVVNLTFADEGIEVFAVGDGNEAIDRLMEIAPDLVMADVNMPGISGYQVCERIRQTEKFNNIPVILLVGSFEPFDESEARRVGANDFLTKPFQSIRQLVSKVTDLLEASESGEMSSAAAAGSFEDTRELNPPVESYAAETFPRYDETEIDDEMIQTNQSSVSGFAYDEVQKFSSNNYVEETSYEEDYAKTQPLSAADLREINFGGESSQAEQSEKSFAFQNDAPAEDESNETFAPVSQSQTSEFSMPENVRLFENDDDDDFLELPSFDDDAEEEDEIEPQASVETATAETPVAETETSPAERDIAAYEAIAETPPPTAPETSYAPENEPTPIADETPATASISSQLSPEMIDAIAQRVIEKLSNQTVKEIAWEVVPQQADLIIKKMVEEKLKE